VFNGINPNDIKQGALGNAYFLSAVSALAEWPERVESIFATKEKTNDG
jgi:calpain-15